MDTTEQNNNGNNSADLPLEGIDISKDNKSDKRIKTDELGRFVEGTAPGPGRTPLTVEEKAVKKVLKEDVENYRERLSELLPQILPILKEALKEGKMEAIKEVHKIVVGEAPKRLDLTSKGEQIVIPIYGGGSIQTNNSNGEDIQPKEKN